MVGMSAYSATRSSARCSALSSEAAAPIIDQSGEKKDRDANRDGGDGDGARRHAGPAPSPPVGDRGRAAASRTGRGRRRVARPRARATGTRVQADRAARRSRGCGRARERRDRRTASVSATQRAAASSRSQSDELVEHAGQWRVVDIRVLARQPEPRGASECVRHHEIEPPATDRAAVELPELAARRGRQQTGVSRVQRPTVAA